MVCYTGAPLVQPVLPSPITVLDGTLEEFIEFRILNASPEVLEEDLVPDFIRYDGASLSYNFSAESLSFRVFPVYIFESEGKYTLLASNSAGVSASTVYLDVQSESWYLLDDI